MNSNMMELNLNEMELNLDELELVSGGRWRWKNAVIGVLICAPTFGMLGQCLGGPTGAVIGTSVGVGAGLGMGFMK